MKLTTSESADPNYLCSVVRLKHVTKHPNADRLQLSTVFGNQVVLGQANFEGELMLYFPVETTITAKYLSWANMFEDVELNADPKAPKGYFSAKKRRVRPARLRGEVSNGIVIPAAKVAEFFKIPVDTFTEGASFDTIGDTLFVEKYVPKITKQGGVPGDPKTKKDLGVTKLLLPNQFRHHSKTTQLGVAVHNLKPSDHISVTSKLHGTSAVFANVLCNTVPTWREKIAKLFGAKVREDEYKFIYSSRSVVKNRKDGTYTSDVWGQWAEKLEGVVPEGFTLYGEIVGYTSNGRAIQPKGYTYGFSCVENQFFIYRVTYTDRNGQVLEFDWQQVLDFCEVYSLSAVPTYYHGKAADLFEIDSEDPNWSDKFLLAMKEAYLEKPCELCNNGKVREGVCLRRENSLAKNAWKLKSFSFLQEESAARDNDETNIEEEN